MDRHDVRTIAAMLLTSVGIALNLVFLQAAAVVDGRLGRLVMVPVGLGLVVALSGFVEHLRRRGRDMVIVDRVWAGSLVYLLVSLLCSAFFQPRFD